MEVVRFGLIVEGQGEVKAAPALIRRIANEHEFYSSIKFEVRRIPRSQLVRQGELERAIEALSRQLGRGQSFLVLIDADDDCPKELVSNFQARCRSQHSDLRISFVLAKMEYEAWFLAAAKSLSGCGGLRDGLQAPQSPELIRGAKEWLSNKMSPGNSYSPTRHQTAFSERLDLSEARQARSFRKLEKEVRSLLGISSTF